jgi:arsenate reductase
MPELTVYEKPTCTTCRRLAELLEERGIDFERVDYHLDPLPADKIRELLWKAGIGAREALRTREPIYAELELASRELPDDEVVELMVQHPELLQRPFVERGERAVLARPVELVVELLEPEGPARSETIEGPRAAGKG